MNLLLDTGVLLKYALDPSDLSPDAVQEIVNADRLLLSSVSRAEIGIKCAIGKLSLPAQEEFFRRKMVQMLQAEELPYTSEHAALLHSLHLHHRDPFVRMIITQCQLDRLILATTDNVFAAYGLQTVGMKRPSSSGNSL